MIEEEVQRTMSVASRPNRDDLAERCVEELDGVRPEVEEDASLQPPRCCERSAEERT